MEDHHILKELNACATLCNICFHACLNEQDVTPMSKCIQLDRDCADICLLAASFFARQSPYTEAVIKLCADICLQCAEECRKHHHEHCQKCAMACQTCYEMCRDYKGGGIPQGMGDKR